MHTHIVCLFHRNFPFNGVPFEKRRLYEQRKNVFIAEIKTKKIDVKCGDIETLCNSFATDYVVNGYFVHFIANFFLRDDFLKKCK